MANLMRVLPLRKAFAPSLLNCRSIILNRDWQPDPYPKTKAEYERAAKKYNMLVEDYKPIDQDLYPAGDYPDLPVVSGAARDPYLAYDYPELKRNYGEPLHEHHDMYAEDKYDPDCKYPMPVWKMRLILFSILGDFLDYVILYYLRTEEYVQGSLVDMASARLLSSSGIRDVWRHAALHWTRQQQQIIDMDPEQQLYTPKIENIAVIEMYGDI
ncbi:NDUFB8 [Cordylochernes scorpioides]|uniref:NDUFB8 n=1 Tax=Cordylochernes scorpioides TaxID=51811 RepID=A0ABY6L0H5_9ARAC|nr:NDUFB8 [Cordylochernes scorpioides]